MLKIEYKENRNHNITSISCEFSSVFFLIEYAVIAFLSSEAR